jgi:hypothetical protein
MQRSIQQITAKKLYRMVKDGSIDFTFNVQRRIVWDRKRKSLFIDSLLYDMPVPMFFVVKDEGKLHFLDGQQRTTAIVEFFEDAYALSSNILDEEYVNKTFSALPVSVREEIEGYSLTLCEIAANSKEEIEEVFTRLNNGMSLTPFEITRSKAGREVVDFLEELTRFPFFQKMNLNAAQRKRFADEEVALQAMGFLEGELHDFHAAPMRKYVTDLRRNGVSDYTKKKLLELTEFLSEVPFEKEDKGTERALRKSNIPMVFYLAEHLKMSPENFAKRVMNFYRAPSENYRRASVTQSTGARHIKTKIEELNAHFGL